MAEAVDEESARLGVRRPETSRLGSIGGIAASRAEKERNDPTFEGVIIRDVADSRFKIKTRTYPEARHADGSGNPSRPRRPMPSGLSGEVDQVMAYDPEVREAAREGLRSVWERTWRIEGR